MRVSHRVKNSLGRTVGFIADGKYYTYYTILKNIEFIDNLSVNKKGVIRASRKLPYIEKEKINKKIYNNMCKNNPLKRDIQNKFELWKKKWNDYILYVTGARQIGKTTEILKFAYKHYEQIIYVNLSNDLELNNFKDKVLNNDTVFGMITYCRDLLLEQFDNSKNTILIIDEIQESVDIYNNIRTLQNKLDCDIIITGSFLGKTLDSKFFKPAGNLYEIEMMPLSFQEFCRAFNLEETLLGIDLYGKSPDTDYKSLTEKYNIYTQIGGYPAVVQRYITSSSINECTEVIKTIIQRFNEESASYFTDDKCAIVYKNVYKAAFINMANEKKGTSNNDIATITDFVISDTKEHVNRKEVGKALAWLKYSKIIGSCDLFNQGNTSELLPERRIYFMDCGIAQYIAKRASVNNETIQGIIAENFVYSELYRLYINNEHIIKGDRPCCSVYNQYELDFMIIDKNDTKYGIEVKSNNSNNHKSIDTFISRHIIDKAYVAEITRGGKGNTLYKIPIYTVGCRFPYE